MDPSFPSKSSLLYDYRLVDKTIQKEEDSYNNCNRVLDSGICGIDSQTITCRASHE